jgi:hypothetical protein
MKLWKARTARISQKMALSSPHQSVPSFFAAGAASGAGLAASGVSVNAGSLLLTLGSYGNGLEVMMTKA